MAQPDPRRREPERRADVTTDEAIVLKCLEEWTTIEDVQLTLRRRDRRWTPNRVRTAVLSALHLGLLECIPSQPRAKYRRIPDHG